MDTSESTRMPVASRREYTGRDGAGFASFGSAFIFHEQACSLISLSSQCNQKCSYEEPLAWQPNSLNLAPGALAMIVL
eukprot:scaffold103753_cov16-Tisochrysis_lutea.AAC.2